MDFLHHYEAISGQLINQDKSNSYIRKSASASRQALVHSVISFQQRRLLFTYLGHLKISYFDETARKVRDKIFGWDNHLLSFSGKTILKC